MIGRAYVWFPFERSLVLRCAPRASGVYALFRFDVWVYFVESDDIEAQLLKHVTGDNSCISQHHPIGFQFELYSAGARVTRQNALILEGRPLCNEQNQLVNAVHA